MSKGEMDIKWMLAYIFMSMKSRQIMKKQPFFAEK